MCPEVHTSMWPAEAFRGSKLPHFVDSAQLLGVMPPKTKTARASLEALRAHATKLITEAAAAAKSTAEAEAVKVSDATSEASSTTASSGKDPTQRQLSPVFDAEAALQEAASKKTKTKKAAKAKRKATPAPEPDLPAAEDPVKKLAASEDPAKAGIALMKAAQKVKEASKKKPAAPPCEISWSNFAQIKEFCGTSDAETTSVLLHVLGPSTEGQRFWNKYRVGSPSQADASQPVATESMDKELERSLEAHGAFDPEPEHPAKRQKVEAGPDGSQPCGGLVLTEDDMVDPDTLIEDEEGCEGVDEDMERVEEVSSQTGGNDGGGPPQPPAPAAAVAAPEQEIVVQPTEQVEPTRIQLDEATLAAQQAATNLAADLSEDRAVSFLTFFFFHAGYDPGSIADDLQAPLVSWFHDVVFMRPEVFLDLGHGAGGHHSPGFL